MEIPKIFESEYRFCCILWEHQPVSSSELVKLCAQQLGWKKSTTYTVIHRLAERGVLKTENAIVTALITREQVQEQESREFVDRTFSGSLPQFLAAFTRQKKLDPEEIAQIRSLIDNYEEV